MAHSCLVSPQRHIHEGESTSHKRGEWVRERIQIGSGSASPMPGCRRQLLGKVCVFDTNRPAQGGHNLIPVNVKPGSSTDASPR